VNIIQAQWCFHEISGGFCLLSDEKFILKNMMFWRLTLTFLKEERKIGYLFGPIPEI
jgi:hypothetical protein